MRIICNTSRLSQACQNVQKAVSSKTTLPPLEGILFEAADGKVKLTGFDLDVGIVTSIDARVEEAGDIIINARLICDILRKLPEDNVTIETDERQIIEIECGQTNFSIIGIRAEEFPSLPAVRKDSVINISGNTLKNMIRQTIFAVDNSDNKPQYKGVCFNVKEGELDLVATDGYRLSLRREKIDYEETELKFVVPAKALSEVGKLVEDSDEEISVYPEKRHIVFETGEYTVVSRLLEGDFLDYEKIINQPGNMKVKINRRLFAESVERISIVTNEKIRVALRCVFNEDTVKISCNTSIGKAMDKFSAEISGERIEIGFSNKYLLDALHNIEDDEVMLTLTASNLPMIIKPLEGDSYSYMVLPVKMKNG